MKIEENELEYTFYKDKNKKDKNCFSYQFPNLLEITFILLNAGFLFKILMLIINSIFLLDLSANYSVINTSAGLGFLVLCILFNFLTIKTRSYKQLFIFQSCLVALTVFTYKSIMYVNIIDKILLILLSLLNFTFCYHVVTSFSIKDSTKRTEFSLINYFSSLPTVIEELKIKLDLFKININNLIISSGYRKHLSFLLFKLEDYSFSQNENTGISLNSNNNYQTETQIKNEEKNVFNFSNISNSCSTIDTRLNH